MRTWTLISLVVTLTLLTSGCANTDADQLSKRGWEKLLTGPEGAMIVQADTGELIGRLGTETRYGKSRAERDEIEFNLFVDGDNLGYRIMSQTNYPGNWMLIVPGDAFQGPAGLLIMYDRYAIRFVQRRSKDSDKYYALERSAT